MEIERLCPNCMNELKEGETKCSHCGHDPKGETEPNTHALKPYTILQGKYLVGNVIGEGGFGITYIGLDLNLEVKIAIKEFYPNGFVTRESGVTSMVTNYTTNNNGQYEKWKESFVREARSLAKFSDLPGIVHVRDFFQENNTAYIVMEFVEGETLKAHLKKCGGKISIDETLTMMLPVIQSLASVHGAGIVHRDISPDNIMIQNGGTVKLIDFGAARDFGSEGEKSLSVLLKPGYAPEEQYRSKGNQGPWTDVYAMCATIYRCITGEKPAESMERMRKDELQKPSSLGIAIDPAIENALMCGMAVYAEDRIKTMGELEAKLYISEEAINNPVRPSDSEINEKQRQTHEPQEDKKERLAIIKGAIVGKIKISPVMLIGIIILILLLVLTGAVIRLGNSYRNSDSDKVLATASNGTVSAQMKNEAQSEEETTADEKAEALTEDTGNGEFGDDSLAEENILPKRRDLIPEPESEENSDKGNNNNDDVPDEKGIHEYSFVVEDVTWEEAFSNAQEMGGYLAHFNSDEESEYIIDQIRQRDLKEICFYIGGRRFSGENEYYWIDSNGKPYGERLDSDDYIERGYWLPGEPSYKTETGSEYYIDLIYRKDADRWYWNDIPNDLIEVSTYWEGRIGYIVEFDN